eukprot:TRINITY_DN1390_c2_g1_i2.p1 TRINITY_DN1390_c2_g1~~TRINITY_DN1390_c2_g1_i2.p1  ORF type:complete len:127 (+),score=27.07 TRINITY_DN1390_c2_g1_i2:47-427(+)
METLLELSDSKCSALLALISAHGAADETFATYAAAAQGVDRTAFRRRTSRFEPVFEFATLPVFQGGFSRVRMKMRKANATTRSMPVLKALNPQVLGIVSFSAPSSPPQASNSALYVRRASHNENND